MMLRLQTLLDAAKPGQTVQVPDAPQGDLTLRNLHFEPPVTIRGGSFRSVSLVGCSGLTFAGPRIAFTPDAMSQSSTPAFFASGCSQIALEGATLTGGLAIAGTKPDATVRAAQDAVVGLPTGQGVSIFRSRNVRITRCEVSRFDRGIGVAGSSDVEITDNRVHDLRRTHISGGGVQNLLIQRNSLKTSRPWNWGQTPLGDHADFIAIATNPSLDPNPSVGVRVLDNLMDQGAGTAILGVWFQGQYGDLGFEALEFARNTIILGNAQGVTFKSCRSPVVRENVFLQCAGGPKDAPQIMWFSGTTKGLAEGNTAAAVSDLSGAAGALANVARGTVKPPLGIAPAGTLAAARARHATGVAY